MVDQVIHGHVKSSRVGAAHSAATLWAIALVEEAEHSISW